MFSKEILWCDQDVETLGKRFFNVYVYLNTWELVYNLIFLEQVVFGLLALVYQVGKFCFVFSLVFSSRFFVDSIVMVSILLKCSVRSVFASFRWISISSLHVWSRGFLCLVSWLWNNASLPLVSILLVRSELWCSIFSDVCITSWFLQCRSNARLQSRLAF